MSEILVNTIKKADGTGSITVPADSGTLLTSLSSLLSSNLSGALPSLDGSSLTNLSAVDSTGSNSNGTYIKLKGGVLICWATNTVSGCNQGPTATGIYTSPTWTWTYPVAFDSTPIIQTTVGGGHYNHLSSRGHGNSTSATINTWDRSSNSYDQGVYALAIGTWS
jgi:hypothetical protein